MHRCDAHHQDHDHPARVVLGRGSSRLPRRLRPRRATRRGGPGPLRLGFVVEGEWAPAGAAVTQDPDGTVHAELTGPADPGAAAAQLARVLSLDVDGSGLAAVARRDPVVGDLWRATRACARSASDRPTRPRPGPCCRNASASGRPRSCSGASWPTTALRSGSRAPTCPCSPRPWRCTPPRSRLGLPSVKAERLQAVADGGDGRDSRCRPAPVTARRRRPCAELRGIPGIGPFSSELVLVRGAGHPDVFPATEGRLHAEMARAYQLDEPGPDRPRGHRAGAGSRSGAGWRCCCGPDREAARSPRAPRADEVYAEGP